MHTYISLTVICVSLILTVPAQAQQDSQHVDESGNISLPKDFRVNMTHLGSWYVPSGDASGFHDVYTQASSVKAYRKTKKFPNGTILIKELRASKAADYTTGAGVHSATDTIKQTFVMIKDEDNNFSNNKSWGNGWGWALFKGDNVTNLSKNYQQDCLGCHVPVKNTDWIYVQGYPTLRK